MMMLHINFIIFGHSIPLVRTARAEERAVKWNNENEIIMKSGPGWLLNRKINEMRWSDLGEKLGARDVRDDSLSGWFEYGLVDVTRLCFSERQWCDLVRYTT